MNLRLLAILARVAFVLLILGTGVLRADEEQVHGLIFERWIDDTFFEGYRPPSPTEKWDVPAAVNRTHGGVPVNPKAAKYGGPVDLGDALRQFDIQEPFVLVIGYWKQDGPTKKRFVNVVAVRIEPEQWRKLWGPITRADLEKLDAAIKDRALTPAQARAAAKKIKNAAPFTDSVIVVNPKIDSKTQRRLQCSLRFSDVFKFLAAGVDQKVQSLPTLWGVALPRELPSAPRTKNS